MDKQTLHEARMRVGLPNIQQHLTSCETQLNPLILGEPSGDLRNLLTELNIHLMAAQATMRAIAVERMKK